MQGSCTNCGLPSGIRVPTAENKTEHPRYCGVLGSHKRVCFQCRVEDFSLPRSKGDGYRPCIRSRITSADLTSRPVLITAISITEPRKLLTASAKRNLAWQYPPCLSRLQSKTGCQRHRPQLSGWVKAHVHNPTQSSEAHGQPSDHRRCQVVGAILHERGIRKHGFEGHFVIDQAQSPHDATEHRRAPTPRPLARPRWPFAVEEVWVRRRLFGADNLLVFVTGGAGFASRNRASARVHWLAAIMPGNRASVGNPGMQRLTESHK